MNENSSDPETSRVIMAVIKAAGRLIWCLYHVYPPPTTSFPIFSPSLTTNFSNIFPASASPPPPPALAFTSVVAPLRLSISVTPLTVPILCLSLHFTLTSSTFFSSTAPPSVWLVKCHFYITIVDEVFILNICSYLIFFLLSLIKAIRFYWCQLCLRINDLYACLL